MKHKSVTLPVRRSCPFCGGDTTGLDTDPGGKQGFVWCDCGISGPRVEVGVNVADWESRAIEAWNERYD